MDRADNVALEISCTTLPSLEPVEITVARGSSVKDVITAARVELGNDEERFEREDSFRWKGQRSGDLWTLRENRDIEEGKWWTEAEVEGFRDRLLADFRPGSRLMSSASVSF